MKKKIPLYHQIKDTQIPLLPQFQTRLFGSALILFILLSEVCTIVQADERGR